MRSPNGALWASARQRGALVPGEALCIAAFGGLVGCLGVLPLNGMTTGAMNWQTFSHLAFAFRVTPDLLLSGLAFALAMGLLGGLPPAVRAARANVAAALRAL